MAQFPLQIGDNESTIDALNYLLSGPAGLGQNFAGFSSYTPSWLTGNFRTPFGWPSIRNLYVAPINLATSEFLDSRTLKFTFSAPQAAPPFEQGNIITIADVTIPPGVYDYNGTYQNIGVVECTTTYCTVRLGTPTTVTASASGGNIGMNLDNTTNSTECNARVTVTGATDRVFISGQLDQEIDYDAPSGTGQLEITVQVNRYRGFINEDPINPDYLFNFDDTIAEKVYVRSCASGTGTLDPIETVFTTLIDQPNDFNNPDNPNYLGPWTAYYWYILEVYWTSTDANPVYVTSDKFGLRSLSSQVVKQ
jgi:hypothetical protein